MGFGIDPSRLQHLLQRVELPRHRLGACCRCMKMTMIEPYSIVWIMLLRNTFHALVPVQMYGCETVYVPLWLSVLVLGEIDLCRKCMPTICADQRSLVAACLKISVCLLAEPHLPQLSHQLEKLLDRLDSFVEGLGCVFKQLLGLVVSLKNANLPYSDYFTF